MKLLTERYEQYIDPMQTSATGIYHYFATIMIIFCLTHKIIHPLAEKHNASIMADDADTYFWTTRYGRQ